MEPRWCILLACGRPIVPTSRLDEMPHLILDRGGRLLGWVHHQCWLEMRGLA